MKKLLQKIYDQKTILVLAGLVLMVFVGMLGNVPSQSDFLTISIFATAAFLGYALILTTKISDVWIIFILGILTRLILVFAFPNLSDDIYRFVWDGRLITQGINPYGYLPTEVLSMNIAGLDESLFSELNSPEYYTIYPPITQFIFYISTVFTDDIAWSAVIIKSIFLMAEVFTFFGIRALLIYLRQANWKLSIYWLNPLVIVEGIGNLHFEILMVVFLIWALYFLFKDKIIFGTLLFSFSVASKLLPLMFLPFFLLRLKGKTGWRIIIGVAVFCLVLFSPIAFGLDFVNFGKSIDLYFQKFEFNASIYYVLRWLGKLFSGYNLIHYLGPLLGLTTIVLIVKKAMNDNDVSLQTFFNFALFAFTSYLFLATTIHPWYLVVPLVLSVFSNYRFVLVWSALIFLTYINYSYSPYWENLWVVFIEYIVVVAILLYEYSKYKSLRPNSE